MSTKIYTAWRVSLVRLNGFIDAYHDHCWEGALDKLEMLARAVEADPATIPAEITNPESREHFLVRSEISNAIDLCEEAAKSHLRTGADIETGLNIWIRGRYAYVVPYGEESIRDGFKVPKYARDYGYWNNTDKPNNVSGPEWYKRKNMWRKLCLGEGKAGHNARRLTHDVVNLQGRGAMFVKSDLQCAMSRRLNIPV